MICKFTIIYLKGLQIQACLFNITGHQKTKKGNNIQLSSCQFFFFFHRGINGFTFYNKISIQHSQPIQRNIYSQSKPKPSLIHSSLLDFVSNEKYYILFKFYQKM